MSSAAALNPGSSSLSPEAITAASRSNFALSFLFLPKNRRRGITHFYAVSRRIDDAVDEAPSPEEAERQLAFWRKEVALCYEAEPTHRVTRAMQETIREFSIPKNYLDWLIEGCEMDLKKKRYENFEELYQYCFRVAGVIGLTSMKIFGLDGETERQAAEELGLALQLTNILRDIRVDYEKGRVYLPQEELKRFQLTEAQLVSAEISPTLKSFLNFQAERAQGYYDRAFAKMKQLPRRPLIAAWIMGRVYQRILNKIRERNFDVYSEKITVSKVTKLRIALSEAIKSL